MPRRVAFTTVALKQMRRIDPTVHTRIERAINIIALDLKAGKPLRVSFRGRLSYRVGDWRIIYSLESDLVRVHSVAHRSRAYR